MKQNKCAEQLENRNSVVLTYAFLLISLVVLTCCKSQSETQLKTQLKSPPKPGVEYKHGTKLIVQYLSKKDETSIYQQEFKIQPQLIVNGKEVNGKHGFELNNTATYKGQIPSSAPYGFAFTLTHTSPNKNSWRFPPKTKFVYIADGERVEIPVYNQTKFEKDLPEDPDYYEMLIIESNLEMYSKIAKAKSVEFQIGSGSFKLTEENLLAFRDFAGYLTLQ